MQVSVIGLGKLGAPWVAVLGSKGFEVIGVDRIPAQVAALQEGRSPVAEPGLQALLSQSQGRIKATTSIKDAIARTMMNDANLSLSTPKIKPYSRRRTFQILFIAV